MRDSGDFVDRFHKKYQIVHESGCWIWTGFWDGKGYGCLRKGSKMVRSHRISYTIHFGEIPEGMCVMHKCDTPSCVNPSHLSLGTNKDNVDDRTRKGRSFRILSEDDVRCILLSNETQVMLASKYGVSREQISNIRRRKKWRHVNVDSSDASKQA